MAKQRGYYRNGRMYKSKAAYFRSIRGMFANMNVSQRKSFRPVIIDSEKKLKKPISVKGEHFRDVSAHIEKRTVLKSVYNNKTKKYELKQESQTYRVNSANLNDPVTGTTSVVEVEEASRYTPADLDYTYEEIGGGVTQVNAVKDKRIVKSTITSQKPPLEAETSKFSLQQRFELWDKTKDEEDRLSQAELKVLGKELGVQVGGGKLKHPRATFEKRIRAKIEDQRTQSQQLNITRDFPQTTKTTKRSKGKTFENQDEINLILATEMANEKIYPVGKRKEKKQSAEEIQDELELLLTGAQKKRPDKEYNKSELAKGVKTESEHTTNKQVAKIIAKDHLDEDTKYYDKLAKVEKAIQLIRKKQEKLNNIKNEQELAKKRALSYPKGSKESNEYWKKYYALKKEYFIEMGSDYK